MVAASVRPPRIHGKIRPAGSPSYVEENAGLVERLPAGRRAEAADALPGYLDAAETELLRHLGG